MIYPVIVINIVRGMTEDYYLNDKSHGKFWNSPEELIKKMAQYYKIGISLKSPCLFPFITIFKRNNQTHWNFFRSFANRGISSYYKFRCSHLAGKKEVKYFNLNYGLLIEPDIFMAQGYSIDTILANKNYGSDTSNASTSIEDEDESENVFEEIISDRGILFNSLAN